MRGEYCIALGIRQTSIQISALPFTSQCQILGKITPSSKSLFSLT